MKYLLLTLAWFGTSVTSAADFKTYYNDRFNYQIEYPSSLRPQGESENSDGQVFKNNDVELRVWGGYYPETIDESFTRSKEDFKEYHRVDERKKNNSYILSGENDKQIAYFKTIYVCDENINMRFYYPKRDKAKWSPIINHMVESFKFSGECKKEGSSANT